MSAADRHNDLTFLTWVRLTHLGSPAWGGKSAENFLQTISNPRLSRSLELTDETRKIWH